MINKLSPDIHKNKNKLMNHLISYKKKKIKNNQCKKNKSKRKLNRQ